MHCLKKIKKIYIISGLFDFILKIFFTCSRTVVNETLQFVEQDEQTYVLKLPTPLACPAQPLDCTAMDTQGQQYDLSALSRTDANWEIPDYRETHKNLKYLVNVCRPVVQGTAQIGCPGKELINFPGVRLQVKTHKHMFKF